MSDNKREYARQIRRALKSATLQAQDNLANIHIPTPGQCGAVVGIINRICGGDDNRKLMLGWLFAGDGETFDRLSTKTLSDAQWAALYAWCDFRKDEENVVWKPKDTFAQECLAVLSAAMDDYFNIPYAEQEGLPEPPEIVANAVSHGGGEITTTGVRSAGLRGVPDTLFSHDKEELLAPETPPDPYRHVAAGEKLDLELEEEVRQQKPPALKPVMQKKPKLYNPFE